MYITNVTDYDNTTNDYDIITLSNCTINENIIDIIVPALI